MICKLIKGRGFKGAVDYCLKPDATLLKIVGVRGKDKDSITASFIIQSRLNDRVKCPVGHHILSFSPDDTAKLNDEKMLEIANLYLRRMGIVNTQLMIVRHYDRKHPHVHIIFNRVNNDGKTISDKNDRWRAIKICRDLTMRNGLTMGKGKRRVNRNRLHGADYSKYYIFDHTQKARSTSRNWKMFQTSLASCGIDIQFHKDDNDKAVGISFSHGEYNFFGSKIDHSLSFARLSSYFEQKEEESITNSVANDTAEVAEGVIQGTVAALEAMAAPSNGIQFHGSGGSQSSEVGWSGKKSWWDMTPEERRLARKGYSI